MSDQELIDKLRTMAEAEQAEIIKRFGNSLLTVQDFTAWKAADRIQELLDGKPKEDSNDRQT